MPGNVCRMSVTSRFVALLPSEPGVLGVEDVQQHYRN
jgi:hypothetical protein